MSDNPAVNKQAKSASAEAALMPPVNVFEDAAGIILYADLPGVPKDKLKLRIPKAEHAQPRRIEVKVG